MMAFSQSVFADCPPVFLYLTTVPYPSRLLLRCLLCPDVLLPLLSTSFLLLLSLSPFWFYSL